MQKSYDQMNIHVHHAISDLTGVTGMAIIDAILAGERDPARLAAMADRRIKAGRDTLTKALQWCKRNWHLPITRQQEHLSPVLRGHCGYYGRTGNGKRLGWFRYQVIRAWRKWLSRRCRAERLNWGSNERTLKPDHCHQPGACARSIPLERT